MQYEIDQLHQAKLRFLLSDQDLGVTPSEAVTALYDSLQVKLAKEAVEWFFELVGKPVDGLIRGDEQVYAIAGHPIFKPRWRNKMLKRYAQPLQPSFRITVPRDSQQAP